MNKIFTILALLLLTVMSIVSAQPTLPAISDVTLDENQLVTIEINLTTGPDNGSTTWATNFTSLTKTTSNDTHAIYTWTPSYTDAGVYNVEFNVSDVNTSDVETMSITVNNVNRAPVIQSTASITATQGLAYTTTIVATDADGDAITYNLAANAPSGMVIDSSTGTITWTPVSAGSYVVDAIATDGTDAGNQTFTIVVSAPTSSFTVTDVLLGDSSQERDETVSSTMVIRNTGSSPLTSFTILSTANSLYNVSFTPSTISTLAGGATATITVNGYVPETQNAGQDSVGTISVTANSVNGTVLKQADLVVEAENNLDLKSIEIIVNGESEKLTDAESIKIYPDSEIEVIIEAKNTHRTEDIEDVTFGLISDELDIDEDKEVSKIKDGDRDEISFSFSIDDSEEGGNFDAVIWVIGEDENGAIHGEYIEFDFDLEEEGILITEADFSPAYPTCGQKEVRLIIELSNIDSSDEDEVIFEVSAPTLNYRYTSPEFEIQDEDDVTRTLTIPLTNVNEGDHEVVIYAYRNTDEITNRKELTLSMPTYCGDNEDPDPDPDPNPDPDPDDEEEEEEEEDDDSEFVDYGTGSKFGSSLDMGAWGTVLLVLANILVIVIIIVLIIRFLL